MQRPPEQELRRHALGPRQSLVEPARTLDRVAVRVPVPAERGRQAQHRLELVVRGEPAEHAVERGPEVVVLDVHSSEPLALPLALQLALRLLGEVRVPAGVAAAQLRLLAGLGQPLEREAAHGLQHPEARLARDLAAARDEADAEQGLEPDLVGLADLPRSRERPAAAEDGEPREQLAVGLGEQVVAPVERAPECLLPRRRVARALDQDRELVLEPRRAARRG